MSIVIALILVMAAPLHAGERKPSILESAAKMLDETRLDAQVKIQSTEPPRVRRPVRPALLWIVWSAIIDGMIAGAVLAGEAPSTPRQGNPAPPG